MLTLRTVQDSNLQVCTLISIVYRYNTILTNLETILTSNAKVSAVLHSVKA